MVVVLGFELTNFQFVLVLSLVLVLVFGPINMILFKIKKKKEEEGLIDAYKSSYLGNLSPEEERAKTYIEQYRSSYSRDSIKQVLVSNGDLEDKVEEWLDKYY